MSTTVHLSFISPIHAIKSVLLPLLVAVSLPTIVFADCTISSDINASSFLGTYGSCTGVMTIPSGVTLTMDADLTIPGGIHTILIEDGGRVFWPTNSITLTLATNTSIIIENTTVTTGTSAALATDNCNNTRRIRIGTVDYAACTGMGNVCILFSQLITAGGTIRPEPMISITSGSNNTACFPSFDLEVTVTGFTLGTLSYAWTQTSGPGTSTFSPSSTTQNPGVTVNTPGTYTYRVDVTDPGNTECTTSVTVNRSITITVLPEPAGSISGNATACEDDTPPLVTFTNTQPYPVVMYYNLNGGGVLSVNVAASGSTSIMASTVNPGVYMYDLDSIRYQSAPFCTRTLSGSVTVTINPNATIQLTSAPGTDMQTLCAGTPITPITYAVGGGGTGAFAFNLPAGVSGVYSSGVFTITGTPTVPGIYQDSIATVGTCQQTYALGTITVLVGTPETPGVITGPTSLCPGTMGLVYSINPVPNALTYNWSVPSGWSIVSGAGSTSITVTAGGCTNSGNISVTATNGCGTSPASSLMVSSVDAMPPSIVTCPVPKIFEGCNVSVITNPPYSPVTVSSSEAQFENAFNLGDVFDNCGISTVTYIDVPSGECPINVNRTWTVTDVCGNTSTCVQLIKVRELTKPVMNCPSDLILECSVLTDYETEITNWIGGVTATDNCDLAVSVTTNWDGMSIPAVSCDLSEGLAVTFTATDDCGNSTSCVASIILFDSDEPSIICPLDLVMECATGSNYAGQIEDWINTTITSDLCDMMPALSTDWDGMIIPDLSCDQSTGLWINFTAADECLGETSCGAMVYLVDTTDPYATTAVGALNDTLSCSDGPGMSAALAMSPVFADACDLLVVADLQSTVSTQGQDPNACTYHNYTITRTWTATDDCGNTSDIFTQVITVEDIQVPVVNQSVGALDRTVDCDDVGGLTAALALLPTFTDNCDPSVPAMLLSVIQTQGTDPESCTYYNYTITRTWSATDACGNTSAVYTQVITVQDIDYPLVNQLPGALNVTVECDDPGALTAALALAPTFTDNCDPTAPAVQQSSVSTKGTNPQQCNYHTYTITRTWNATDACGNTSPLFIQVITVQDTEGPVANQTPHQLDATVQCDNALGLTLALFQAPTFSDNCDPTAPAMLESAVSTQGSDPDECSYYNFTITRTWTALDACDNVSAVYTQVITVQDTKVPVTTTAAGSLNATVQCDDPAGLNAALALFPSFSDNCDQDVPAILVSDVSTQGSDPDACNMYAYTRTRKWTGTDACGNVSAQYIQVITVQDMEIPVVDQAPGVLNVTLECDDLAGMTAALAMAPTYTDNCDPDVNVIVFSSVSTQSMNPETCGYYDYTITRSLKGIDACGNASAIYTQVITVEDTEPPVVNEVPGALDLTLDCHDTEGLADALAMVPTWTDNCDLNIPASLQSSISTKGTNPEACDYYTYTITRTWTGTDACGNTSASYTQVISVQDMVDPVANPMAGALNVSVECDDPQALASALSVVPTFSDNCDPTAPTVLQDSISTQGTDPEQCDYYNFTITRTWNATDACGNTSMLYTQVVTVQDTEVPLVNEAAGALHTTVDCDDPPALASALSLAPTFDDNCDPTAPSVLQDSIRTQGTDPEQCEYYNYTITRTWNATDACGNTSNLYTQVVTIQDTQAPTANEAAGALNAIVECDDPSALASALSVAPTFDDNCDPTAPTLLQDSISTQGANSEQCDHYNFTITRTWNATDACGNTSNLYTQTVVVQDTESPLAILTPGALDVSVASDDTAGLTAALALWPSFNDNCDPTAPTMLQDSVSTQGNDPEQCDYYNYTITRSWNATDACLNTSLLYVQVITVFDDEVPMPDQAPGALDATVECDDPSSLAAALALAPTFSDNSDSMVVAVLQSEVSTQHPDPEDCGHYGYTITRTWVAEDGCENQSLGYIQVITVQDTEVPLVNEPVGALNDTMECDDPSALATALSLIPTFDDNCDPTAPASLQDSISTQGMDPEQCDYYNFTITRTWNATDACGNTSLLYTQVVTVRDTEMPLVNEVVGALDATVECDDPSALASALSMIPTFDDNCDPSTPAILQDSSSTQGSDPEQCDFCNYTITRMWNATDACGHTSALYTQVVTVQDTEVPLVNEAAGALNITLECDDPSALASALSVSPTFGDNCDPTAPTVLQDSVSTQGTDPELCDYYNFTITRTWNATDACGHTSALYTQVVTVQDSEAPLANEAVSALNTTVECDDPSALTSALALFPTFDDNCDPTAPTVLQDSISTQGMDPEQCDYYNFTITRTWNATDACGNTSALFTQVVTVQDTEMPLVNDVIGVLDATVECDDPSALAFALSLAPTFGDNCDPTAPTVLQDSISTQGADPEQCDYYTFTITRTWNATDACGNTSLLYTQVVTVQDTEVPLVNEVVGALNTTVECDDPSALAFALSLAPTFDDNCDPTVPAIVQDSISTQGTNPELCDYYNYTITRTWNGSDACGNTSVLYTQVVTVQDTEVPIVNEVVGALNTTVECDDPSALASALALAPTFDDNCDPTVPAIVQDSISTQGMDPEQCDYYNFTITRTWNATDACGNTSVIYTQVVTVQDTEVPVVNNAVGALNITVECDDPSALSSALSLAPTFNDNCDPTAPTVLQDSISTQGTDPEQCDYYNFTITRTWNATDACGNTSVIYTQVVTVQDTEVPLVNEAVGALNTTVECDDPSALSSALSLAPTFDDNCDPTAPTVLQDSISTQGADPEQCDYYNFTITRTWNATDACGNTSVLYTQVVTVQDTEVPLVNDAVGALNATVECDNPSALSSALSLYPTFDDNCDPTAPTVLQDSISTQGTDPEQCNYHNFTITRTWNATDACGNTSLIYTQVVTVQDTEVPLVNEAVGALNTTVECDDPSALASALALAPTFDDNCDLTAPTALQDSISTQGTDPEQCDYYNFTITRTWNATDACGNTSILYTQVVTVEDTEVPLVNEAVGALNTTVECDDPSALASALSLAPTFDDNCDPTAPTVLQDSISTQGTDPEQCDYYNFTITRTWNATDACGNTSVLYTQVVIVQDTEVPQVNEAVGALNITVECDDPSALASALSLFPTFGDNCDPTAPTELQDSISTQGTDPEQCDYNNFTITRTWNATDACGNTSALYTQVVTVQDTEVPLVNEAVGALNTTVECDDPSALASALSLFPTFGDNCDPTAPTVLQDSISTQGSDPEQCDYYNFTITRIWNATDACGNTSALYTQVVTVQDTEVPLVNDAVGVLNTTVECDDPSALSSALALAPTFDDNCDPTAPAVLQDSISMQGTDPEQCDYYNFTITRTWNATDACGNTSILYTQVVTVQDTEVPLVNEAVGALNTTVECDDPSALSSALSLFPTFDDNCDPTVPAELQDSISTQGTDPEQCDYYNFIITRTWNATDACGNTSVLYTQVVTVQDTEVPIVNEAVGALNTTVECDDPSALASALSLFPTFDDNCDPTAPTVLQDSISTQGTDPELCDYYNFMITRTWNATDACGNTSALYTQVVTVQDTEVPLVNEAVGALNVTVECDDPSALSSALSLFPTFDDNCDLTAPTVLQDSISTQGSDPELCDYYNFTITRTWNATDACGNTSLLYTQVVTVQDTEVPLVNDAVGALNVTVECDDPSALSSALSLFPTFDDNCDPTAPTVLQDSVSTQGSDPEQCDYYNFTITRTWNATDACGNTSVLYTQVVTVQDTEVPLVNEAVGALNTTVECDNPSALASALSLFPTFDDNCDPTAPTVLQDSISTQGSDPEQCDYYNFTITRTWNATDACGNTSAIYTQVVTVQDTEVPLVNEASGALNTTVECDDPSALSSDLSLAPTFDDNCDPTAPTVLQDSISTQGSDPELCDYYNFMITRTWNATDACGNTSVLYTQVVTVQDTEVPLVNEAVGALNTTVECDDPSALASALALFPTFDDNCDPTAPTVLQDSISTQGTDPEQCDYYNFTITRTWNATDACGNTSVLYTQVVTVQDTEVPLVNDADGALNMTVECDDPSALVSALALFPTFDDNCDPTAPTLLQDSISTQGSDPEQCDYHNFTITRTWNATDACGNTSLLFTQVVTVEDTEVPLMNEAVGALNTTVECDDPSALASALALFPTFGDNCDPTAPTVLQDSISTQGTDPEQCDYYNFTITRTWNATDACGNTSLLYTQVVTVEDTEVPLVNDAVGALNTTVECDDLSALASALSLAPTFADNCDPTAPSVLQDSISTQGTDPEQCDYYNFTITRTWNATDACGNTSALYTQVVTIQDTEVPLVNEAVGALNRTVECDNPSALSSALALFPTFNDNCDPTAPTVLQDSISTQGTDPEQCDYYNFSITRTWNATDACGHTSLAYMQVITVQDTEVPVAIQNPGDLDVLLESSDTMGLANALDTLPQFNDSCDPTIPTVLQSSFSTQGQDPEACDYYNYTITRTWTGTDACNNESVVYTQIITVQDTEVPMPDQNPGELDATLECDDPMGLQAALQLSPTFSDNSDSIVTVVLEDSLSTQASDPESCAHYAYTITRIWVAEDGCANQSPEYVQIITVQDTEIPLVNDAVGALNTTVECDDPSALSSALSLFPTFDDNCDPTAPTVLQDSISTQGSDPEQCDYYNFTITRTWNATDACGNTSALYTQVVTVQDTEIPLVNDAVGALNTTVECDDPSALSSALALFPTFEDNCDPTAPTVLQDSVSTQGTDPEQCDYYNFTITRTWNATDACGNTSALYTQVVTVQDTEVPLVNDASGALNTTVECDDPSASASALALFPTFDDNCDPTAPIVLQDSVSTQGTDPEQCDYYNFTITRTWNATDACGNTSALYTQVVTIQDTEIPLVNDDVGALNTIVECDDPSALSSALALFPTFGDNCDPTAPTELQDSISTQGTDPEQCDYYNFTITRTWNATDACGNTSLLYTQLVTVQDTEVPLVNEAVGALNMTVECDDPSALASALSLAPTFDDNCDPTAPTILQDSISTQGSDPEQCDYYNFTITRTWNATDACGNTSLLYTQLVTVQDTEVPLVNEAIGALNTTVECDDPSSLASAFALFPTFDDNCDPTAPTVLQDSISTQGTDPEQCDYHNFTITRTWNATDACGNTSVLYTQVVTVQDTEVPLVNEAVGALNTTVECDNPSALSSALSLFPTFDDNCDPTAPTVLQDSISTQGSDPEQCDYYNFTITRTWNATDACGNTSALYTQVVTVQDTEVPLVNEAIGALNTTVECDDPSSLASALSVAPTFGDNCDPTAPTVLQDSISTQGTDPELCDYYNFMITRTWNATDACGNTSVLYTQVVTVQDTEVPLVNEAVGALNTTVECDNPSALASALSLFPTFDDNCDPTAPIVLQDSVSTQGTDPEQCDYYNFTITRTWNATDACGNTSALYTQVVTVQDTEIPLVNDDVGALNTIVECDDPSALSSALALFPTFGDNCDPTAPTVLQESVSIQGTDPEQCDYYNFTITRTWNATDACGNTSALYTQVVTVQDTEIPLVNDTVGALNTTVQCDDPSALASALSLAPTFGDNCDPTAPTVLQDSISTQGTDPEQCDYHNFTITRTWNATDACGNTSLLYTQLVTVQDTEVPLVNEAVGALNTTVECDNPSALASALSLFPTFDDNCDPTAPTVLQDSISTQGTDPEQCDYYNFTITRTWNATDACGNTSLLYTQLVTVQDTEVPLVNEAIGALNTTVECDDPSALASALSLAPTFGDNCDPTAPTVLQDSISTQGTDPEQCDYYNFTITRTWNATDACGNTSALYTQVVTVQDTEIPLVNDAVGALNTTVECDDPSALSSALSLFPTFDDNCDPTAPTVLQDSISTQGSDPEQCDYYNFTITRTWNATDACGNTSALYTQVVTVQDTEIPLVNDAVGALNTTVECDDPSALSSALSLFPTFDDNCDPTAPTVLQDSISTQGSDPEQCDYYNFTITRTWNATDACGNTSALYTQVVTVQDTEIPLVNDAVGALNTTVECNDPSALSSALSLFPTFDDNCDPTAPTVLQDSVSTQGTDPEQCDYYNFTITRTWNATDACGNTSTLYTQLITVQDTEEPVISTIPGSLDTTLDCHDAAGLTLVLGWQPAATDNCDASPIITLVSDTTQAGSCTQSYVRTRTWTFADRCGNISLPFIQTIVVQDTSIPLILTLPGVLDTVLDCHNIIAIEASLSMMPLAMDLCDPAPVISLTTDITLPGDCPQTYTRIKTWTFTDDCNNTSAAFIQTLVVQDTLAPAFIIPADTLIDCHTPILPAFTGMALAMDLCDVMPLVSFSDMIEGGSCMQESQITRSWTTTDACGNSATGMQVILTQDTMPPTLLCPPDTMLDCHVDPVVQLAGMAIAVDLCDPSPFLTYSDAFGDGNCLSESTITRTWYTHDMCENEATCVQMIMLRDTTPPEMICPSDTIINCHVSTLPSALEALQVADLCDPNPEIFYTEVVTQGDCVQEKWITRTWFALDVCDNIASCIHQISVQDTTPPVVNCPPDKVIDCMTTTDPSVLGTATAIDLCATTTEILYTDMMTPGTCPAEKTISRTWMAIDPCDNVGSCVQSIFVQDTTPPVIQCPPLTDPTVQCPAWPVFGMATATDICDNAVGISFETDTLPGECMEQQILVRTWTAIDDCGNASTCSQAKMRIDTLPPVAMAHSLMVSQILDPDTGFYVLDPDLIDDGSFDLCGNVTLTSDPDTLWCLNEGANIVTLIATDACGNTATATTTITFDCIDPCLEVNTWLYLEGATTDPNGQPTNTIPMRTTLNDLRVLPGQTFNDPFYGPKYSPPGQPYSAAPWSYPGNEGDPYDSNGDPMLGDAGYPATVVDWVLVSLRADAAGTGGPVCQAAAMLHQNGWVEFVEPFDCCDLDIYDTYYLVMEHRNHLIVMSHQPITPTLIDSTTLTYDFRNQQSYVDDPFGFGIFSQQKEILTGVFAMIAGNGNQTLSGQSDTDINFDDRTLWESENGFLGEYRTADYNMNADTNFNDRVTWDRNNGMFTSVPRN